MMPPAQTRREKRKGREAGAHLSPRASPLNLCRGSEAGGPGKRLLGSRMPTGRPHISWAPASTHWALIIPASLHLPLDSAYPIMVQPLQPSGLLNQSPRRVPEQRRPQPFGQLFRRLPLAVHLSPSISSLVPQPLTWLSTKQPV